MKTLRYTNKALKQLQKLPLATSQSIVKAIQALENWPDCRNVKSLSDKEGFRIRIGDFRAVFEIHGDSILVTEVKKRNERTYN